MTKRGGRGRKAEEKLNRTKEREERDIKDRRYKNKRRSYGKRSVRG